MKTLFLSVVALFLMQAPAGACSIHGTSIPGLLAADPASIPVALATRSTIAAGALADLPTNPAHRQGTLGMLFFAASALPHLARETPSFAVLLIESGHWLRFGGGAAGASAHTAPPPGTTVLVLSDAAFAGLLAGTQTPARLMETGALAARGAEAKEATAAFARTIAEFTTTGLGARMAKSARSAITPKGGLL